jgi:hypothetical protein
MLRKYTSLFSGLMVAMQDTHLALYADSINGKIALSATDAADIQVLLTHAASLTKDLDLDAAHALATRLAATKVKGYTTEEMSSSLRDLQSRIEDQLQSRHFLFVQPAKVEYFHSPSLFGQQVNDKFAAAISDIQDAGTCLAVGLGTSAVMHLMRVTEVGLKALAASLKIPYAPSWESYLRQIQTRIDAKHKTKGVQWKRDEKFYRDVSGDLLTVKQAWRNPTMHIDRRYSPQEAEEVLRAVRALMQRLAMKL